MVGGESLGSRGRCDLQVDKLAAFVLHFDGLVCVVVGR